MTDPERFHLTIEAERHPTPAVARLKRLLKRLKRGYGFHVVSIRPVARPDAPTRQTGTQGAS